MSEFPVDLRKIDLFRTLSEAEAAPILGLLKKVTVRSGSSVVREGETGSSLYVIVSGRVEVRRAGTQSEVHTLTTLGPGQHFGEMAFLETLVRTADVVASEDSELLELSYGQLETLIREKPELGVKIFQGMARTLSQHVSRTTDGFVSLLASARMVALGEMASVIVHDINNPLAILLGRLTQLEDGLKAPQPPPGAKLLEWVQSASKTGSRITKIIGAVRAYNRQGKNDPYRHVKFAEIMEDVLILGRKRFENKGIELRIEYAPDLALDCNPTHLLQVLLNLLNNAHDATEALDEKWVELRAEVQGPELEISVTDAGTGIPPEIQEKIFKPLFTTKEVGKGTGLGLSICTSLVEDHGGKLYLDKTAPHTRFVVRIPVSNPAKVAESLE